MDTEGDLGGSSSDAVSSQLADRPVLLDFSRLDRLLSRRSIKGGGPRKLDLLNPLVAVNFRWKEAMHWQSRVRGAFGSRETAPELQWEPPGDPEDRTTRRTQIRGAAGYLPTSAGPQLRTRISGTRVSPRDRSAFFELPRCGVHSLRTKSPRPPGVTSGAGRSGGRSLVGRAGSLAPRPPQAPGSARFENWPREQRGLKMGTSRSVVALLLSLGGHRAQSGGLFVQHRPPVRQEDRSLPGTATLGAQKPDVQRGP